MRVNDWAQAPSPLPYGVEGRGGGLGEWKMVGQGVKKGGRVKNKRRCLLDQRNEDPGPER